MNNYYEQSECGTYRVCAFHTAQGWLFELWKNKEMLATRLASASIAKALVAQQEKR